MSPAREPKTSARTDDVRSTLHVEPDGTGGALVVLAGELDQDCASELRDVLVSALSAYPKGLVLDLADVTFCDCACLNVLLRVRLEAGVDHVHRAHRFRVRNISARVSRLLDLTGTLAYFPNGSGPG
ncbi:STAS domain-containing protein [Streptomyces sp. NBC_01006]|uniref:STAS domain-containing protein n=1 Tax=Streptomyces sp. NBC_01006 TaxID=2903716 RepID=UPI00386AAD11|nr:STAS domain-containing protein [Streptomyces sp. NBC_01006]